MPTTKTRINISVSDTLHAVLKKLARRDQVPTATKAERLLKAALEIEEDEVWDTIAGKREEGTKPRYLTHEQAWQ